MAVYPPKKLPLRNGEATLRSLEAADAAAFIEFQQQIARETPFTLQVKGLVPDISKVQTNFEKSKEDGRQLSLGAFVKDKLGGIFGLHPLPSHPWTNHVASFGMMVLKTHWGSGMAKVLLHAGETHARKIGIQRLEATVRTHNDRGVAFYQKMGFKIEGTRVYSTLIDGKPGDEFYIAKFL